MVRWCHWAVVSRSLLVTVFTDMSWPRKRGELDDVCRMRPIIHDVQRNVLNFLAPQEVDIPRSCEGSD